MELRLHVFLARAGMGSRREMEKAMVDGRVTVDGNVVKTMGTKIDPSLSVIALDGRPASLPSACIYVMLNKPQGVLSTVRDDHRRRTVVDLLPSRWRSARVFPVGRLDMDSDGLMLMTNDGELAHRLMHPRFQHEREYLVTVDTIPSKNKLRMLTEGIKLDDGLTAPAVVEIVEANKDGAVLRVVLREGKNRQIKRMMLACGIGVLNLHRVRIGKIQLGDLGDGESRELDVEEQQQLFSAVGL